MGNLISSSRQSTAYKTMVVAITTPIVLYARSGELRTFNCYAATCHWHPNLEFILVTDGAMDYFVNGQTVHIDTEEGIFVNSRRLHYGYSADNTDCTFLVVAVHPTLLGAETPAGKEFMELKFGFDTEDYILLSNKGDWQKETLARIKQMYAEVNSDTSDILRFISSAASLCSVISKNIKPMKHIDENSWLIIRNMTDFIHRNYESKITINDIGASGAVCRSKCCRLYGQYIGQTPNEYLTRYRVNKSCEMLRESNMSICEIALACGFHIQRYN